MVGGCGPPGGGGGGYGPGERCGVSGIDARVTTEVRNGYPSRSDNVEKMVPESILECSDRLSMSRRYSMGVSVEERPKQVGYFDRTVEWDAPVGCLSEVRQSPGRRYARYRLG